MNNVPLTGQTLGVTRVPINNNFSVIGSTFEVDHVGYNLTDQGKHAKITMPSQGAVPSFSAGEIGLFNQNAAPTNINDIWLARGAAAPYPMTG